MDCGLKTALVSLGKLKEDTNGNLTGFELISKTKSAERAFILNYINVSDGMQEEYLSIEESKKLFPMGQGTYIKILTPRIHKQKGLYRSLLKTHLETKFGKILNSHYRKIPTITIKLTNLENITEIDTLGGPYDDRLIPQKRLFRREQYMITEMPVNTGKGKGNDAADWSAQFNFGLTPLREEFDKFENNKLILEQRDVKTHPFHYQKATIDIYNKDLLLICQKPLTWLGFTQNTVDRYSRNGFPIIEIFLGKGFDTNLSKTDIVADDPSYLNILKRSISENEQVRKYVEQSFKSNKSETTLAKELFTLIQSKIDPTATYEDYAGNGRTDIEATILGIRCIIEIKKGQAKLDALYQLYFYLHTKNMENGIIIAEDFTEAIRNEVKRIEKDESIHISLQTFKDWNINPD